MARGAAAGDILSALETVALLTVACALSACAARPEVGAHLPGGAECRVLEPAADPRNVVSVALMDEVDPRHAPVPQNPSERLLFAHLYETLVRVGCDGQVTPALAESWRAEESGRRWRFTLRAGARYWNGAPVTADDVALSWLTRQRPGASRGIVPDAVRVESERVLVVELDRPRRDPHIFAAPELAVVGPASSAGLPPGTGPYRVEVSGMASSWQVINVVAAHDERAAGIAFRLAAGRDARDLLDAGIDVMVTDDRAALEYVDSRPSFISIPLPWDRTYALLAPSRVRALRDDRGAPARVNQELLSDTRRALARDAVRVSARGFSGSSWWRETGGCVSPRLGARPGAASAGSVRAGSPSHRRIVYASGDRTARDLADRLVALARAGRSQGASALAVLIPGYLTGGELSAAGLGWEEFDAALAAGDEYAYVMALPRRNLDPCSGAAGLAARAPWLEADVLDLAATLVPLVDARRHLVARRGAATVLLDWDGMPRILAPSGDGEGAEGAVR